MYGTYFVGLQIVDRVIRECLLCYMVVGAFEEMSP
jgi:hypothetical protein